MQRKNSRNATAQNTAPTTNRSVTFARRYVTTKIRTMTSALASTSRLSVLVLTGRCITILYASRPTRRALMTSMSQTSIVGKARPFTTSFSEICTCCGMMSSSTMPMTRNRMPQTRSTGYSIFFTSSFAPHSSSFVSVCSIRFFTSFNSFLKCKSRGKGMTPFPLLQLFRYEIFISRLRCPYTAQRYS